MSNSTIVIICLLSVICILLIVLLRNRNQSYSDNHDKNTAIVTSDNSLVRLSEVSEIVLENSIGQELTFKKPAELTDAKYMEVNISGAGSVIQHSGQGAGNIYTLKQLGNITGKELYTHPQARSMLHEYGGIGSGNYSSTFWGSDGKIVAHEGYRAFDASKALAGVNPVMITMVVMQGMAIISGQYFLKQINSSLQAIGKDIQELKEIHESEKRGTLTHCRKRLMEISQMQHCSDVDLNEIRNIANDAGKILEEYKERYYAAKKDAEKYRWSSGTVNKGMREYNNRLYKMRYLLQVCMVADRIIDEARLTEFVVRQRININDPALQDVYTRMEDNYHNGFNAHILGEIEDISKHMINKGWGIINDSTIPYRNTDLIHQIEENMDGMQEDVIDLTASVRRIEENRERLENVALLLSENEEPRLFVEIHDDATQE